MPANVISMMSSRELSTEAVPERSGVSSSAPFVYAFALGDGRFGACRILTVKGGACLVALLDWVGQAVAEA